MKTKAIISLSSKLREKANNFIIKSLKKYDITDIAPSHGDIIALLFNKKVYTMAQIAQMIHRSKATVTVLVDKLEKNGYIIRQKCDEDARIIYVSLTQKGERLLPVFEEITENLNRILYDKFTEFELNALEELLKKAVLNLEKAE